MTKKDWLSQPAALSRRITYLTVQPHNLLLELDAVSSPWGECSFVHTDEAPYVRKLERIETVREKIRTATDLYDRLRAQIEETILRLPNENMRLVLLYHYLEGRSFSQIGDILFLNKGSAARCAARAVEELILPPEPIDVFPAICNESERLCTDTTPLPVVS